MIKMAGFVPDVEYHSSPFRNRLLKRIVDAKEEILISTPFFTKSTATLLKQIILSKEFEDPFDIRVLTGVTDASVRSGSMEPAVLLETIQHLTPPELSLSFRSSLNIEQTFISLDAEVIFVVLGKIEEASFKDSISGILEVNDEDVVTNIIGNFDDAWRKSTKLTAVNIEGFMDKVAKDPVADTTIGAGIGTRLTPFGRDTEPISLRSMDDMVYELLEEAENVAFDEDFDEALNLIEQALGINANSARANLLKGKFLYHEKKDPENAMVAFSKLVSVNDSNEEGHFHLGLILFEKKKDIDALESFDRVTMINPDNEKAWYYKGVLLARAFQKYDDAIKCLDMAIKLEPYLDIAWLEKGLIYYKHLDKIDEGLRYLQGAIRINPDNLGAQILKAKILLKVKKDKVEALKVLEKLLKKDPSNLEAIALIEKILTKGRGSDKDIEKVLQLYDNALKEKPDNIKALLGKGRLLYRTNSRFDEALQCLKRVLTRDKGNIEALVKIAKVLLKIDKAKEAVRVLDEAQNLDKKNDKIPYLKGLIFSRTMEKHSEAHSLFDAALKLNPANAKAWYEKGHVLSAHFERFNDAIYCFDKSLRITPDNENAWYDKGIILSQQLNDPQGALICFDEATKINPNFELAWYDKAIVLCSYYNRFEDAILCFNKVLELNPNDQDAWYNKGNALADIGRYDEALICFDNTLMLDPEMWQAWGNKGNILDTLGRYLDAVECFDNAIKLNPNDETAWYNKGNCLINLGRYREAIQSFEMTLSLNPYHEMAEKNRTICYNKLHQMGYQ